MYFCIEGIDGVGKSTQAAELFKALENVYGASNVVLTSEPGTTHSALTMECRKLMLDARWENEITADAREYVSQAARSVNLQNVVLPALARKKIIIQDRGLLSGFAYGMACGHSKTWLQTLARKTCAPLMDFKKNVYDFVIVLTNHSVEGCLQRAKRSKTEFKAGDAIENRGSAFMNKVADSMNRAKQEGFLDCELHYIDTTDKSIADVHAEILALVLCKVKLQYI